MSATARKGAHASSQAVKRAPNPQACAPGTGEFTRVFILLVIVSHLVSQSNDFVLIHSPRRKACDEEGCTSISVRGSKCKAHASPSNKCHVRGCRKAATNEGACMRHYTKSQSEANRASIPILGAASKNIQSIPQMCMPISSAGYASMMTSQAGLIGFPVMGVNVGLMPYMHPAAAASLLYNIQSNYLLGAPGAAPDFGALGEYHRNLIESRARAINNMTANTLAKLDSEKEKLI